MSETALKNKLLISVVLPVYNGIPYLQQSIQSIIAQQMPHFELLIVDDASTDGSLQYLQSLHDSRIQLFINKQNLGLFYNLNFLIGKCTTGLIKLWAQDDVMYPFCLDRFVSFYLQHPGLGFIYSQRDIIDEKGNIKDRGTRDITPPILTTNMHAGISYFIGCITGNISSVCIYKEALQKTGLFNEQMKISADFDMWVRLAQYYDTGFINENLLQLRDHKEQLSRKESLYIYHLTEDLQVYQYLDSYVSAHLLQEGKKLMRHHKLVFYYTLMIKALMKGQLKTACLFYKALIRYDNFLKLTVGFMQAKLGKKIPVDYLEKFK